MQPGSIATEAALTAEEASGIKFPREDTAENAAAFYLWLTSRNAEFLSGRYVSRCIQCKADSDQLFC